MNQPLMVPITIMCDEALVSSFMGYMSDGGGEYGYFDACTDATDGKYSAIFNYDFKNRLITLTKCDAE